MPARSIIKAYFYKILLVLLSLGVVFFILLNLVASLMQPQYLKALLKSPQDFKALKTVLLQNQNPQLDSYLKDYLQKIGDQDQIKQIEEQKRQSTQAINKLAQLLQEYPQYPDGHAYLAVLYYERRQCDKALELINQAILLDLGRSVFKDLKQVINQCLL